jgi:hypothetical protein
MLQLLDKFNHIPHHLHIGEEKVVSSYIRSIEKVLEIISKEIG